jgi:hypothetical protein
MTEAGFFHAYRLAQPTRRFQIGCRLITTSQLEQLMKFYSEVSERHWFTWQLATGTAEAGTSTSLDDNGLTYNFNNEYRDRVLFMVSGTGSGQIRRVTQSSSQSGGTRFQFSAVTTPPSTDTVYIAGWPVRIVGGISRQAFGNNLYNADFTLEEVILTDTV